MAAALQPSVDTRTVSATNRRAAGAGEDRRGAFRHAGHALQFVDRQRVDVREVHRQADRRDDEIPMISARGISRCGSRISPAV